MPGPETEVLEPSEWSDVAVTITGSHNNSSLQRSSGQIH